MLSSRILGLVFCVLTGTASSSFACNSGSLEYIYDSVMDWYVGSKYWIDSQFPPYKLSLYYELELDGPSSYEEKDIFIFPANEMIDFLLLDQPSQNWDVAALKSALEGKNVRVEVKASVVLWRSGLVQLEERSPFDNLADLNSHLGQGCRITDDIRRDIEGNARASRLEVMLNEEDLRTLSEAVDGESVISQLNPVLYDGPVFKNQTAFTTTQPERLDGNFVSNARSYIAGKILSTVQKTAISKVRGKYTGTTQDRAQTMCGPTPRYFVVEINCDSEASDQSK